MLLFLHFCLKIIMGISQLTKSFDRVFSSQGKVFSIFEDNIASFILFCSETGDSSKREREREC